jgi:hypothetical protein
MGEAEKYGIKELEEVMVFGISLIKEGFKSLTDGVDIGDLFSLLPVLKLAPDAIKGFESIPSELGDLSDVEVGHLTSKVKELLKDVPDAKAKAVALKGLQFGLVGVQLFNEIKPAA